MCADETAPHVKGGVTLVLNCLRSGGAEKQLLWIASEIVSLGFPCSIFELIAGERTERIETMVRAAAGKGVEVKRATPGAGSFRAFFRLSKHLRETQPDLIWSWGLRADGLSFLARAGLHRGRWLISVRSANLLAKRLAPQRLMGWCSHGIVANTHAGLKTSGVLRLTSVPHWVLPNAVLDPACPPLVLPAAPPPRLVLVMLGNIKIRTKGYDICRGGGARIARPEGAFRTPHCRPAG